MLVNCQLVCLLPVGDSFFLEYVFSRLVVLLLSTAKETPQKKKKKEGEEDFHGVVFLFTAKILLHKKITFKQSHSFY